jgi:hypothetical protein
MADDLPLVPHFFEDAVAGAVERLVVERRHSRAEGSVPCPGEVAPGFVAAEGIGAVRRHLDMVGVTRGADAAGRRQRADKGVLLGGRPAVVAVTRGSGEEIVERVCGGSGGGAGGCHRAVLSNQPTSLCPKWLL